jgi:predicted TIM-barrel fold metal-dependent hydrolase
MKEEREAWLAQVEEPVLEPERRIVDPHHHLWHSAERHGDYLVADLHRDTGSGHRVEATVFVECMSEYRTDGPPELRPVGETAFVAAQAAEAAAAGGARIAAIVGFADLLLGDAVEPVLAAHVAAGDGLFRGIRHAAGWDADASIRRSHTDPPADLYQRPAFRAGLRRLGATGLSFDAWSYHPQIPDLTAAARAAPDTQIVLDHVGGPLGIGAYAGRRDDVFLDWRAAISALAACDNVAVKLGGLAMPINGFGWHKRATPATSDELVAAHRPYYEHCLEVFGPDRCMFESNFPVDKQSVSYRVLWNGFKKIAAGLSEDEKDAVFRGTASRVYRIGG